MADFLMTILNIVSLLVVMFLIVVVSVVITVGGIYTAISLIEWILGGFING